MIPVMANPCIGGGHCCHEKFQKYKIITWMEPEPKNCGYFFSSIMPSGKVLLQTNVTDGKTYSPKVCLLESYPPDIKNPNGEPQTHLNFGFQNFISSTLSDVEKFAEFNSIIFFKSEQVARIQNSDFAVWPSRIDACRQYSILVSLLLLVCVSVFLGFSFLMFS